MITNKYDYQAAPGSCSTRSPARSAAYSRAVREKFVTADTSLLNYPSYSSPLLNPLDSKLSLDPSTSENLASATNCSIVDTISTRGSTRVQQSMGTPFPPIFRPRMPINIGAFNVRTLKQIVQQAAFARTLDTLNIDVCCVSETRIQDSTHRVQLTSPSLSTQYWLYTSGDSHSAALGQAGVGIALSTKAASSLIDWIPISSRLCAVRLEGSIKLNTDRKTKRCLFVISCYAPTDCSEDAVKDAFYQELSSLLRSSRSSDIILLAGDLNAQVGELSESESRLGGVFGLPARRSDNGDRLLQLCAEYNLFLSSTSFRNRACRRATWRPPSENRSCSQIDHIAISYRWRGCIRDCRSYWNTCLESDHALVCCRFALTFAGKRVQKQPRLATDKLSQANIKIEFENAVRTRLDRPFSSNIDSHWNDIARTLQEAGTEICGTAARSNNKHWVSAKSLQLLDSRRQIPSGNSHNKLRRNIRKQLKRSLLNDRETWLNDQVREMEKAQACGNIRRLFQLIRTTGPKSNPVSESIKEKNGTLVHNKSRRLGRWAEYFKDQFSWPLATIRLPQCEPVITPWDVKLDPPTLDEVRDSIRALKRFKAPGPDNLVPALFKDAGESLVVSLTGLFHQIWTSEDVPKNWGESVIVPLFKKGSRNLCENHRGISLTPVITRMLASIILHRLRAAREANTREEQAGFRPGRGCIDHIFTLRQILEQRHIYRRPTIVVFLDYKGAFDSVDRIALLQSLQRRGLPQKYVGIISSLYASTSGCVRVYGELSNSFTTKSGVRQGCPLSPFLFNFVIDEIMEHCLSNVTSTGVEMLPGEKIVDLEYADDKVLLFDNFEEAQLVLNRISESANFFGMRFAPSKCKMLIQDCDAIENLSLYNEPIEVVDNFTYLGSSISNNGGIGSEIRTRISKARLVFASLKHLWHQKGLSLHLKGRVYKTTVRAVPLYGCETWPLRVEDLRQLQTFDNRCLRSIAHIGWQERVSNCIVRQRVFGNSEQTSSLSYTLKLHRSRWLGHVLRMPHSRLPRRAVFAEPPIPWRKSRGGQPMTWQREMKAACSKLGSVGRIRLPGWGPRDSPVQWLRTLEEMAGDRAQWRECCRFLAESCMS